MSNRNQMKVKKTEKPKKINKEIFQLILLFLNKKRKYNCIIWNRNILKTLLMKYPDKSLKANEYNKINKANFYTRNYKKNNRN